MKLFYNISVALTIASWTTILTMDKLFKVITSRVTIRYTMHSQLPIRAYHVNDSVGRQLRKNTLESAINKKDAEITDLRCAEKDSFDRYSRDYSRDTRMLDHAQIDLGRLRRELSALNDEIRIKDNKKKDDYAEGD